MTKLEKQIRYHLAVTASHNSEFSMAHLPKNEILTFEPVEFDFIDCQQFISVMGVCYNVVNNRAKPTKFLNIQEIELN